jgi:class 3 adenylate cyclase
MALKNELELTVKKIFHDDLWSHRDGQVVPEPEHIRLGNDAVHLDATVLYADMSDSTKLVDNYEPHFAAEVYKAYLACAARIIKNEGGAVTAYDGDRIMAVFIGDSKNTSAVRSAFKINGAIKNVIKPALSAEYPQTDFGLKHVIGIDSSKILVSRIGVKNDNDLVWVGRAANYAAKLSSMSDDVAIRITHFVYDHMHDSVKLSSNRNMWEERSWTPMGNLRIYRSNWTFGL